MTFKDAHPAELQQTLNALINLIVLRDKNSIDCCCHYFILSCNTQNLMGDLYEKEEKGTVVDLNISISI